MASLTFHLWLYFWRVSLVFDFLAHRCIMATPRLEPTFAFLFRTVQYNQHISETEPGAVLETFRESAFESLSTYGSFIRRTFPVPFPRRCIAASRRYPWHQIYIFAFLSLSVQHNNDFHERFGGVIEHIGEEFFTEPNCMALHCFASGLHNGGILFSGLYSFMAHCITAIPPLHNDSHSFYSAPYDG